MEKMTTKEMFAEILKVKGVAENTTMVDFINHEIELLTRKGSKSTPSKTQIENEGIKKVIVNALTEIVTPVTITDLQAKCEDLTSYSNQKISALLKQLVDSGVVVKSTDKKKSYFTIA